MKGSKGAVLATIAAGLLWGSSFAVVKIGLRSIDPFWFVFLRFAAASVLVILLSVLTGRARRVLVLLKNPLVVWLGISNAAGFVFQFKGQTMTTAANAALLINASTIFVAVASRVVFRERFGPLKVLAVLVGMAGVFLVTTGGRPSAAAGIALRGDLLVLTAALLWTFFILLNKQIVAAHTVDVHALTAAMVAVTTVIALPVALVFGRGNFPKPSVELWTVPYTAVFCSIAPFYLWTWGLKRITATTSSIVLLTEVVFALALAAVLLGERLSPVALVGSALILAAVALASREKGEEAPVGPDVVPEETGVQPVEEQ
ncbi:MAG: DMT family transporter [Candidatus Eisenbacteria sp.]|nr:DMT family transporter [Candidatus Eisenbacteria bacterium]